MSITDRTHVQREADKRDTGTAKMVAVDETESKRSAHVGLVRIAAQRRYNLEFSEVTDTATSPEMQILFGLADIILDLLDKNQIAGLVETLLNNS
jgi:hypothetical protein